MSRARRFWGLLLVATLWSQPLPALAMKYDISLRGVGRPQTFDTDANGRFVDKAVRRYRYLANELTMAMAPRPLAPAETLGLDGFEVSLVSTITPINFESGYWQGQPGSPVFEGVAAGDGVPEVFWTPTVHIRKGLPMSMELGVSGSYLAWSEMFMLGVEYKIAWHESFFRWAPAFATRVAFSRLFGSRDLSIITGEVDAITSLPFGIGGMASLTPYLGYGQLFANIDSTVVDETPFDVTDPTGDQKGGADGSLYNFPTVSWDNNAHGRLFLGTRLIIAFIEILVEWDYMFMDGPNNMWSVSTKIGFDT
jgi:hypothetical protein